MSILGGHQLPPPLYSGGGNPLTSHFVVQLVRERGGPLPAPPLPWTCPQRGTFLCFLSRAQLQLDTVYELEALLEPRDISTARHICLLVCETSNKQTKLDTVAEL